MRYYSYLLLVFLMGLTPVHATSSPSPEISKLLRKCQKHLKANRLTSGVGGTALSCYNEVLEKDSNNAEALAGLTEIEARYVKWAKRALDRNQKNKAKRYLTSLRTVNPKSPKLLELEARIQPPASSAAPPTPASQEAAPSEQTMHQRKAQIVDAGQIYELINTTDCLTWPRLDMKEKGGKAGWGSFYPKKGELGLIISEMKHCHFDEKVYILEMDNYYVPISSVGIQIMSEESATQKESVTQ
jgi:hypothetical protein